MKIFLGGFRMAVVVGSFDELDTRQPHTAHETAPASGLHMLTSAYRTLRAEGDGVPAFP